MARFSLQELKEAPEYLAQLAQWHHAEWTHLNPGLTLQERMEEMQDHLNADSVPTTFVAHKVSDATDQSPILLGSASVIANDMDTKPELRPWLASVYVDVEQRKQGVGGALVKQVMAFAKANGVKDLYLFTPDQKHFYQNLGWQVIEETDYRGEAVTVMSASLA